MVSMTNRKHQSRATVLLVVWAVLLAGCHYEPKIEENAVPRPEEYKEQIESFVRNQLADPTGIRGAFISQPALRPVSQNTMRYVICFKYDARDNADRRRYSGVKEFAAIFYDRRIQQFAAATPEFCGQAAYQPYPEVQKLCREIKCPS